MTSFWRADNPEVQSSTDAPRNIGGGRYRIQRVLGEGGQKTVYLANDVDCGRACAISFLKSSADVRPADRVRFQEEARAMIALKGHTTVVEVYDFGEDDGAPYLVTEYVPGGDLQSEIRAYPNGMPVDRVLSIAKDVAEALSAAHESGVVHRDLTPRNIWLCLNGKVKLGDFGLALGVDAGMTANGRLLGTAAYMSPEQALGLACDARSDLYSLGVLVYELATGRQPFVGEDALAVIAQHINSAPVAPRWHRPGLPIELETLIMRLLEKVPDDRLQSAAAVCAVLDETGSLSNLAAAPNASPNPLERLAGGIFVGRDAEIDELRAGIESAIGGNGQFFLIAGEPGIGKTRLTELLATFARLRRASVSWGRCIEGGAAPPFWPWLQALQSLADTTGAEELRDDVGDGVQLLAQVLPGLASLLDVGAPAVEGADSTQLDLFKSIALWLSRSSKRRPIVLLLDDLHWADAPSVQLLQYLLGHLAAHRIFILGTYRDTEIGVEHPLRAPIAALLASAGVRQLVLGGLSKDAVSSYIALTTGAPTVVQLSAALHLRTEGNPLYIREVLRMLAESTRTTKQSEWTKDIPDGVRAVIRRRLDRLSVECLMVLQAAAVIGRDFDWELLKQVYQGGDTVVREALDEAIASQLVSMRRDSALSEARFTFSHELVRSVIYDELADEKRVALHLIAATALEDNPDKPAGSKFSILAHHFREAAPLVGADKAIHYAIVAGEQARHALAYEECVRLWDTAIELLGQRDEPVEQARLLQRASDVLHASAHFESSVTYIERAAEIWEKTGNHRQLAGVQLRLGRTLTTEQHVADIKRAVHHIQASIRLYLRDAPGPAIGYAYASLAAAHDRGLRTTTGLEAARKLHQVADRIDHANLLALAMQLEGMFMMKQGFLRQGIALEDAAWDLADQVNDPMVAYYCAWNRGFRETEYRADPRSSIRAHSRELSKPRSQDLASMRGELEAGIAEAHAQCGELAKALGQRLSERGRRYIQATTEGMWRVVESESLVEVRRHVARGNRLLAAIYNHRRGLALFHLGELTNARRALTRAVAAFRGEDIGAELKSRALLCIVESERGALISALDQLVRCDEIVALGEDWRGQIGRVEMARAATLALAGNTSAATCEFGRALHTLKQFELVWDQAETYRLWGRSLTSTGDDESAMEKYREAIGIYRRVGAGSPFIARVVRSYSGIPSKDATIVP